MLDLNQDKGAQDLDFWVDAIYLIERGIWLPNFNFLPGNVTFFNRVLYSWYRKWSIAKISLNEEMKKPAQLPQDIVRNTAKVSITVVRALEQRIFEDGLSIRDMVEVCQAIAELNRSAESLADKIETIPTGRATRLGTKKPTQVEPESVESVMASFD